MVQGVGFRPHVYRLAHALNLSGWVNNSARGVEMELEGDPGLIQQFLSLLEEGLPPHASLLSKEIKPIQTTGSTGFTILNSTSSGEIAPLILPDIAVCPECLKELFDPRNRRYRYPFINCTHCGPRFSIIQSLPYDRPNTTMSGFQQCPDCLREYENPEDRRFHAQPNACPRCGPQLSYHASASAKPHAEDALLWAVESIMAGKILALKGLGGFQLVVDALNPKAVQRLRLKKQRGNKPFALMFPSSKSAASSVFIPASAMKLLESSEAPIVLLEKTDARFESSAPDSPYLGVFLPYTPLHHLLLHLLPIPLVVTSGNLADEPICIENDEAFARLGKVADSFLVHNRPIERPVDDSVVHLVGGELQILRRARGYAPLPIRVRQSLPPTLAVGGHLKSTIAIGKGNHIILSQHIGNLDTQESVRVYQSANSDFKNLYDLTPDILVQDRHPDYYSTHYAKEIPDPVDRRSIQHHVAHVFSCMAEHALTPPVLGFSWDGTGYGDDGSIWGGESFHLVHNSHERVATIHPFRLPGGERAIQEPGRIAASLEYEALGLSGKSKSTRLLNDMIQKGIQSPVCSSMGRIFDGVSALLGLCQTADYEGEAAMLLEFEAKKSQTQAIYHYLLLSPTETGPLIFDWRPMIRQIHDEITTGISKPDIARTFHNTLVEFILETARRIDCDHVLLTGGCFQNSLLTELAIHKLTDQGFTPYTHKRIPPNDGGIAAGQAYSALFSPVVNQI